MSEQGRIVVDDIARNVKLLTDLLTIKGYDVVSANGGEEALERIRAGAVVLGPESVLPRAKIGRIKALSIKYELLTIAERDVYARGGVLLAYGPDLHEMARRAATFGDKILRGAAPGEIPIEQPTEFELVINTKTAKALAVSIPRSILMRADEAIQ